MQNQRLIIAGVAFAVLLGGAAYALNQRDAADAGTTTETPELPSIERDAITQITITRADNEPIVLSKNGDEWRVSSPLDAEADQSAVTTILDKLGDFELTGVAATREQNHARLEVDESGIRVAIQQGEGDPVELIVGAYRGGNTMIRVEGETVVLSVAGSIKYAFNKELKDWRNRRVLEGIAADRVRTVLFESENGTFRFNRNSGGEWEPAEEQEAIERFGSSKVQSIVASIAGMRAVNFAPADMSASAAGFDTPSGTVTLGIAPETDEESDESEAPAGEEGEAEQAETPANLTPLVLHVGGETEDNEFYLRAQDNPVIYVISRYLADRMRPDTEKFQNPEPGAEPATPTPPAGMPGMPGMPGAPGGPGQPTPEQMQQIMQQLQQQGLGN